MRFYHLDFSKNTAAAAAATFRCRKALSRSFQINHLQLCDKFESNSMSSRKRLEKCLIFRKVFKAIDIESVH